MSERGREGERKGGREGKEKKETEEVYAGSRLNSIEMYKKKS